jgi:RNA polymerase sigma factor (TIGR02999 family)
MRGDPPEPTPENVTELLHRASAADQTAAEELMQAIERELRKIASLHMRRERRNHTLQTTAIVNEALIRLLGTEATQWNDRQHFLAVASRVMRRFLVDYARAKQAQKRNALMISLELSDAAIGPISADVIDVHVALEEFVLIAPRQAQLVELRFFGGLSLEEAASLLGISPRAADKDWALARAWLRSRLEPRIPAN